MGVKTGRQELDLTIQLSPNSSNSWAVFSALWVRELESWIRVGWHFPTLYPLGHNELIESWKSWIRICFIYLYRL